LGLAHEETLRYAALPAVQQMAREFRDTADVVGYIRNLAQRDDLGDPDDGPRLACKISQRARFAPTEPNCFERTILYHALAEILEPKTERSSASMVVNGGWHTFPVEFRNGVPQVVVLDPYDAPDAAPPRNAMTATAYGARNVAVGARDRVGPWFLEIARNACLDARDANGDDGGCFERGLGALRNALLTGTPLESHDGYDDLALVLDYAMADAEFWGRPGEAAVDRVVNSVRNLSLALDMGKVSRFLHGIAKAGETIAPKALHAALTAQFGPAAAIALEGVQVAMQNGAADDGADAASKPNPKVGSLQLTLEGDDDDDDGDADTDSDDADADTDTDTAARSERADASRALRRMTFAFRTP
jgi:hypothetical protein